MRTSQVSWPNARCEITQLKALFERGGDQSHWLDILELQRPARQHRGHAPKTLVPVDLGRELQFRFLQSRDEQDRQRHDDANWGHFYFNLTNSAPTVLR